MISLPANWSDWTVVNEIGSGSYSVVYEAVRKDDPTIRCAIKLITIPHDISEYDELLSEGFSTELSRSFFEEAVRDLTREIQVMEHFKGMQNIVSIEDYKVVPKEDGIGSYVFIRMELLTSLDQYLSDKTLTEQEILQIGTDVCTALEFCHEKQIVHRDIKPANIFVNDRLGTHVFYKLGDFGIARNLEGKTQNMSVKGTPNYMAPEVAANLPYNATADLYSLGLTLYYLLNGNRLPFFPQTQLYSPLAKREALAKRLAGEALEAPVNASPEAARVILKACAFQSIDRYQTAAEMKRALQAVLNQGDIQPDTEDKTIRLSKQEKKQKGMRLWIIPAALIVLVGAFLIIKGMLPSEPQTPDTTVPTPVLETDAVESATALPTEEAVAETPSSEPEISPEIEQTETPDPERIAGNQITQVFQHLRTSMEPVQVWAMQMRPDHIMVPIKWDQIPYGTEPENAPEINLLIRQEAAQVFFADVPSHDRRVFLVTSAEEKQECFYDIENDCYTFPLSATSSDEDTVIEVSYQENNLQQKFTYSFSANQKMQKPECISSDTAYSFGDYSVSLRTDPGSHSCQLERTDGTVDITANYVGNDLSGYEDSLNGLSFNREGYLIDQDGNVNYSIPDEGYLFPVVLYSDFEAREKDPAHNLLRNVQLTALQCRKIIQYNASDRIYVPRRWNELPLSALSGLSIPQVYSVARNPRSETDNSNEYELSIETSGINWEVYDNRGIIIEPSESNGKYYNAWYNEEQVFSLVLNSKSGVLLSYVYRVSPDGYCNCEKIQLECYLNDKFEPMETFDDARAAYCISFTEESAKLSPEEYYYSGTGLVEGIRATYGLKRMDPTLSPLSRVDLFFGNSFWDSIHLQKIWDSDNLWVEISDGIYRRIDSTMDEETDPSAFFFSASEDAPQTMEVTAAFTLPDGRMVEQIANRSPDTYRAASEYTSDYGETPDSMCFPSVIGPGETAYLISLNQGIPIMCFEKTSDKRSVPLNIEGQEFRTEGEMVIGEDFNDEIRYIGLKISNHYDFDVTIAGCCAFVRDSAGEITDAICPIIESRGMYDLYLPAGESVTVLIKDENGDDEYNVEHYEEREFYAWGYQEP